MEVLRHRCFLAIAGCASWLWPVTCLAHTPSKGLQGFYTGALHIYSEVTLIVAFMALGLLVGQNTDIKTLRLSAAVFFITILLSSVLAGFAWIEFNPQTLAFALWTVVAVVSLKVALLPNWGRNISVLLVICAAAVLGQMTLPDPGPFMSFAVTMAGSVAACILGFLCCVASVNLLYERYQLLWQRTIFRIFSAWMFAVSFLLLAVLYTNKLS